MRFLYFLYRPFLYTIFPIGFVLMTFVSFFSSIFLGEKRGRKIIRLYNNFSAFMMRMTIITEGIENYDRTKSYVVVANHKSNADPIILWASLNADILWIMKSELLKIPVFGFIMKRLGNIGIDRKNSKKAIESIGDAKKRLIKGTCVGFFPEGTRFHGNTIGSFKKGAFHFASELGLPILPISISGSEKIIPPKSFFVHYGKVKAVIHPPLEVKETSAADLNAVAEKVRKTIEAGYTPDYE